MTDTLVDHLTKLEQLLHQRHIRRDPAAVSALLTDDFREFGASGRSYDKAAILALLASEAALASPPAELEPDPLTTSYQLLALGPTAALLTYSATRAGLTTRRSSLWVLRGACWQLCFHQGTPVTPGTPA